MLWKPLIYKAFLEVEGGWKLSKKWYTFLFANSELEGKGLFRRIFEMMLLVCYLRKWGDILKYKIKYLYILYLLKDDVLIGINNVIFCKLILEFTKHTYCNYRYGALMTGVDAFYLFITERRWCYERLWYYTYYNWNNSYNN